MHTGDYERLNYAELLISYEDRLSSMERGFQLDHDFLNLWVPDENHNKSLYYLFESASLGNQRGLSLVISSDILSSIDGEGLTTSLKHLGTVSVSKVANDTVLTVSFEKKSGNSESLDEIPGISTLQRTYREKLIKESRKLEKVADSSSVANLTQEFQSGRVLMQIELPSGQVKMFRHADMPDHVLTRMFDVLCRLTEGMPLQEISEHGVIRLENYLRDPSLPAAVRGLVSPETAGPNFGTLNQLMRTLFKKAQTELGLKIARNTWEVPIDSNWLSLDDEHRSMKIADAAQEFLNSRQQSGIKVFVVGAKYDTQVYIDIEGIPSERDKRSFCRSFEKFLKLRVEPQLELYLPTALDKMKRDKRPETLVKKEPIVTTAHQKSTERVVTL